MNKIPEKTFRNIERISCIYGSVEGYKEAFYDEFKKSSNIGYFGCKLYSSKKDTLEQRRVEYIPSIRQLYVWNNVISDIPESILQYRCVSGGDHTIIHINTSPDTICIFDPTFKDLKCRKGEEK